MVNRNLGKLLRCLVSGYIATWDLVLPMAKFAYNYSVNRSIRISPFETMTGICPRLLVDLVPLSIEMRLNADADDFIHHL